MKMKPMSTWTLEITGDSHRTIIGVADTAAGSRADADSFTTQRAATLLRRSQNCVAS